MFNNDAITPLIGVRCRDEKHRRYTSYRYVHDVNNFMVIDVAEIIICMCVVVNVFKVFLTYFHRERHIFILVYASNEMLFFM